MNALHRQKKLSKQTLALMGEIFSNVFRLNKTASPACIRMLRMFPLSGIDVAAASALHSVTRSRKQQNLILAPIRAAFESGLKARQFLLLSKTDEHQGNLSNEEIVKGCSWSGPASISRCLIGIRTSEFFRSLVEAFPRSCYELAMQLVEACTVDSLEALKAPEWAQHAHMILDLLQYDLSPELLHSAASTLAFLIPYASSLANAIPIFVRKHLSSGLLHSQATGLICGLHWALHDHHGIPNMIQWALPFLHPSSSPQVISHALDFFCIISESLSEVRFLRFAL
jgi:hypothetical protein